MIYQNSYAQLDARLYHRQSPTPLTNPRAGHFNSEVADLLGWSSETELMERWVDILSGSYVPNGFEPLAMAYAGHQFGQWAGQLGDGRGLLMAQVLDQNGQLKDLHLKGCGLTPYSRMGDGRAVLRSTIREYLCGHALNNLGIKASDALGFVVSDTPVRRERMEPGAALMRVADCHIRLGHIEWIASFAPDLLAEFTDYMIDTYYPDCRQSDNPVAAFLQSVVERTAKMIADWQLIGFAHGVMNTDNLSITGSTIDFGPFGFMERFNPGWINNHSDHTGRYSYQNQPAIGHWNLNIWLPHFMRLPNISRDILAECLAHYEPTFMQHYQQGLCQKLGLPHSQASLQLAFEWLTLLEDYQLDYTNSFRALSALVRQSSEIQITERPLTQEHETALLATLKQELSADSESTQVWQTWQSQYLALISANETSSMLAIKEALTMMQQANPVYILRNSMAQRAIEQAESADSSHQHGANSSNGLAEVDRLYRLLADPYQVHAFAIISDTQPPDIDAPALPISCSS